MDRDHQNSLAESARGDALRFLDESVTSSLIELQKLHGKNPERSIVAKDSLSGRLNQASDLLKTEDQEQEPVWRLQSALTEARRIVDAQCAQEVAGEIRTLHICAAACYIDAYTDWYTNSKKVVREMVIEASRPGL